MAIPGVGSTAAGSAGVLQAAREGVVEAELDELLGDRQRDQTLRGLARHAELAGDLFLGVPGDVVEPGGARGELEPALRAWPRTRGRAFLHPASLAVSYCPVQDVLPSTR
jgi:hypothetical protein